jgi:hypothetical protein
MTAAQIEVVKRPRVMMGMNNVFRPFHHPTKNKKFGAMPARL